MKAGVRARSCNAGDPLVIIRDHACKGVGIYHCTVTTRGVAHLFKLEYVQALYLVTARQTICIRHGDQWSRSRNSLKRGQVWRIVREQ